VQICVAFRHRHFRCSCYYHDRSAPTRVGSFYKKNCIVIETYGFISKDKIAWECDNGGQLWTTSAEAGYTDNPTVGNSFCAAGFDTLNTIFIISLLIDIACQVSAFTNLC
jgi:hypothetical protein